MSDRTAVAELAVDPAAERRTPAPARPRPPLGQGFRTPLSHRLVERAIAVLAFSAILAILLIFAFVLKEALPLLWERSAREHLGGLGSLVWPRQWPGYDEAVSIWQPVGTPPKLNVLPLLAGTLKVTLIGMLISVPMGVGSAIFVSQHVSPRAREIVKPALELLASIPSVVLGFFALVVLASALQSIFGWTYRLNATVAAIGLSLAVIPTIFTISEDSLRAVPRSLIEASMALGARKWQTTLRIVVPAALPGIAAAILLGLGRAIGETMVVLMASGNAAVIELLDPSSSARTVTATIAAELGEVARGEAHWRVLFLLGVLLFVVTFVLNRIGARIVSRLHRKLMAQA